MEASKYNAYRQRFYAQEIKPYKGRILINNLSRRIIDNTRMGYLIKELEAIIQNWFDSSSYIYKSINYRVDKDDDHTID